MSNAETRRSLHAVAELLLAGPQYDASGTIRLRVVPGGFATVALPDLSVVGGELVAGADPHPLHGRTVTEVAAAAGLMARPLADVYTDSTDLGPDHPLTVDPADAAAITAALMVGDEAIAAFAPTVDRVLWPEHFDVGISVDEVNYGVSPGDTYIDEPYAYVGPWNKDGLTDAFWNAPFGATAPLRDLGGAEGVAAYFARGRDLL
jgi:hypothetical protein